jgi:hypothetical protein
MAGTLDQFYSGHRGPKGYMTNTEVWEDEGGAILTAPGVAARPRLHSVTDAIRAGSLLMAENAPLPAAVLLRADSYSHGWSAVTDQRAAFEKEVEKAGLTFFFMAGEIKATVFGFDRPKSLRRALSRLILYVQSQDCNGIEITRITDHSFLKVPYVTVYAHSRHLQKGLLFTGRRNAN